MKIEKKRRFGSLLGVLLCFAALAVFVLAERSGVRYEAEHYVSPYLPEARDINRKEPGEERPCLMIYRSDRKDSLLARDLMEAVLLDMRVGYDSCDISASPLPEMGDYRTAVVLVSDLDAFGEAILEFCDWVKSGGRAMFTLPFQKEAVVTMISQKLGILDMGYENEAVGSVKFRDGFLIGGSREFRITDPYPSSFQLSLREDCDVYAESGDGHTPLIWSCSYGDGLFVVDNLGFIEKAYRGLYAASYSLLEDVCVYPVINGSAFYIDDFPSPVPQGDGTYIRRDYNKSVSDFYANIWWPDMLSLAKSYGIIYTGMIIENYEAQTSGELPRNSDTSRFQFFGNMLLARGGELGFHGYNHQPLCLSNFDYQNEKSYTPWGSGEEMSNSIQELWDFSKGIFPGEAFSVYVPPSNILSEEGRTMLADDFSSIRSVAGTYLPGIGEPAYAQEFEVAEDGIVETPRVISGCEIDDYMRILALSELNMHFVNSHFLHPDDLLDEDRGAAKGWETLRGSFEAYLKWLFDAAPSIRSLTGSQMGGAVERYSAVSLWKEDTPEDLYLTIDGLYDEAYFMVRVNKGTVGAVSGGSLTRLTGNLYLLKAEEKEIGIERNR